MSHMRYGVGEPWPGDPATIAGESFGWHADAAMLLLVADGLSPGEKAGLRGPLDVAVVASGPLVGLLLRLEGWGWQAGLAVQTSPGLPDWCTDDSEHGDRLALTFAVVSDGLVEHLRVFSLSPHVTKVLRQETRDRWKGPVDEAEALALTAQWHAKHGNRGHRAALARCHAGE